MGHSGDVGVSRLLDLWPVTFLSLVILRKAEVYFFPIIRTNERAKLCYSVFFLGESSLGFLKRISNASTRDFDKIFSH